MSHPEFMNIFKSNTFDPTFIIHRVLQYVKTFIGFLKIYPKFVLYVSILSCLIYNHVSLCLSGVNKY